MGTREQKCGHIGFGLDDLEVAVFFNVKLCPKIAYYKKSLRQSANNWGCFILNRLIHLPLGPWGGCGRPQVSLISYPRNKKKEGEVARALPSLWRNVPHGPKSSHKPFVWKSSPPSPSSTSVTCGWNLYRVSTRKSCACVYLWVPPTWSRL